VNGPAAFGILLLIFFCEMTFFRKIAIFNSTPDIIGIFVIFLGLFYGERTGSGYGMAAGIICDVFSSQLFGLNILRYGILGFVSGYLSDKIYRESFHSQVVYAFFAILLVSNMGISTAIYSALAAPVCFFVFSRVFRIYSFSEF